MSTISHHQLYWKGLLGLIALCAIGYSSYALNQLHHYRRLNFSLLPQRVQWSIVSQAEDDFALQARYQFVFEGQSYQGKTIWHTHYLNQWAASEAIQTLKRQPLLVWMDRSFPQHSTLQKIFPLKSCLYAILLWGLWLYFIGLKRYVKRFMPNKKEKE